jgi:putative transposase
MPRTARGSQGGYCYHVLNRGNLRAEVFHGEGDYHSFVRLIGQACARISMRVLGYCLMPNHFHLAVWPEHDGDLSRWIHWLSTAHVRRYRKVHRGSGHIWQGRFKAFPIQEDEHLVAVIRYIERNPLRAALVTRTEEWPWSSLQARSRPGPLRWLHPSPVALPKEWPSYVNSAMHEKELGQLRHSVAHGTPFGDAPWAQSTAERLGLEETLHTPGRPQKGSRAQGTCSAPSLFG